MTAVVDEPTTEVEVRREAAGLARCDVPADLQQMLNLAEVLAGSRTIPTHFRRVEDLVVVMMASRALDVPLFWALQAFHLVEGKLGMEATFMRALLYRAGGDVDIVENTAQRATIRIRRPGAREYGKPVTVAHAEFPHLHGKTNWKQNARAMVMARCTTTGMRQYAPDVLMGFNYSPDELADDSAEYRITATASAAERPARSAATASDGQTQWLAAIAAVPSLVAAQVLWQEARGRNLLDLELDGQSLRDRLTARMAALADAERAAGSDGADDVVDADVEPDDDDPGESDPGADPVEAAFAQAAAAAASQMSCGCDADAVFQTGNHSRGCREFTVPVPAADPRAARR